MKSQKRAGRPPARRKAEQQVRELIHMVHGAYRTWHLHRFGCEPPPDYSQKSLPDPTLFQHTRNSHRSNK